MEGNLHVIISVAVFLVVYAIIISEKMDRMVVAMLGGIVIVLFGILDQSTALKFVDFNTLGLLVGMMILVGITRRSGVFSYLAIKSAKVAKGEPVRILIYLSVITAVASAFLDNVTAVLLIVPVTFTICNELELDPMPFLVSEILACNIGGTATLIGDPPNIMIGSATSLTFNDFIINLAPPAIVIFLVTFAILKRYYGPGMSVTPEMRDKVMAMDEIEEIKDWALLKKSLIVLGLTVLGFAFHGVLHLESATIALAGGLSLLLIAKEEPEDILLHVEWPTIFFFIGLFVLVGGLEHTGVIHWIAEEGIRMTGGNLAATASLILWLSAIGSAFVDNIPFVATMIPLIKTMGEISGIELNPLWWSLALGACLGGNGTIVGASANVIVAGLADKAGYRLGFVSFMKVAFPLMIMSIVIAQVYVWFRYLS